MLRREMLRQGGLLGGLLPGAALARAKEPQGGGVGDAPNNPAILAPFAASGGTHASNLARRFKDLRTPYDFGARGTTGGTISDDTGALRDAFNQLVREGGGVLYWPARFGAGESITCPRGVDIVGNHRSAIVPDIGFAMDTGIASQLELPTTATLNLAGSVTGLFVNRAGQSWPFATPDAVGAAIARDAGKGITIVGAGARVDHCQVVGFAYGIYSVNNGQVEIDHAAIDCTNGIYIQDGGDICQIKHCHVWPYRGWSFGNERNAEAITHSGDGYTFKGSCDWSYADHCFCFGNNRGFVIDGASNIRLTNCSRDHGGINPQTGPGFAIINAATYVQLINCFGGGHPCVLDSTTTPTQEGWTRIIGGNFIGDAGGIGGTLDGIVANGTKPIQVIGARVEGTRYGVTLGPNCAGSIIVGNVLEGVKAPFHFDSAVLAGGYIKNSNAHQGVVDTYPDTVNLHPPTGPTSGRPKTGYIGMAYFDTTLGIPIYAATVDQATGVTRAWTNASGRGV
jgi:hypothetical protein